MPISSGFGNMNAAHTLTAVQIGNRWGNFQEAGVSAGRQGLLCRSIGEAREAGLKTAGLDLVRAGDGRPDGLPKRQGNLSASRAG